MPALTETSSGTRVILLPNKALEGGEAGSLEILLLPHPRTGEGAQYLLNTSSSTLYEILNFREDNRTWFLGDRIVDDGSLLLSTPVDPTFIILPSLIRDRNYKTFVSREAAKKILNGSANRQIFISTIQVTRH